MKTHLRSTSTTTIVVAFALLTPLWPALASSKDAPAKAGAKSPPNIRTVPDVPIPQSVFLIPSQPSEGRNPFFPQSTVRVVPPRIDKPSPLDLSSFVLNGITSPPRRTAMINGRTFEPGEEGEVRLSSGGKVMIKCEQIKADSAIISVSGQPREIRMRPGL